MARVKEARSRINKDINKKLGLLNDHGACLNICVFQAVLAVIDILGYNCDFNKWLSKLFPLSILLIV